MLFQLVSSFRWDNCQYHLPITDYPELPHWLYMTSHFLVRMAADTLPTSSKIAIVGIGCRFADGINSVQDFVRMLREGLDCTGPPPDGRYDMTHFQRWAKRKTDMKPFNYIFFKALRLIYCFCFKISFEKSPGKMYTRRGGYIKEDLEQFDREFFKISPGG